MHETIRDATICLGEKKKTNLVGGISQIGLFHQIVNMKNIWNHFDPFWWLHPVSSKRAVMPCNIWNYHLDLYTPED